MANYLVTGGTGQIGTYVCEELLKEGHTVVCQDYKPNMDNISHIAKRMTVVTGDVLDLSEFLETVKTNGVTRIIHLAASLVLESMQRPAKAVQTNCVGTNNVFEAMRILDIERTVYASSVSVYGTPRSLRPGVVDEDDYPNTPHDPYSFTKVTTELMGRFYRETYGLDIACMRLAATWGPGRYGGYTGQFNDYIRNVAIGRQVPFPDDFAYRDEKLRWFYVKDMGRCFTHVAQLEKSSIKRALYNAGMRVPFNGRDLISSLRALFPSQKLEFRELDAPTKLSATIAGPSGLDVDCSRFYQDLRFEPKYTLTTALIDMVSFERRRAGLPQIEVAGA